MLQLKTTEKNDSSSFQPRMIHSIEKKHQRVIMSQSLLNPFANQPTIRYNVQESPLDTWTKEETFPGYRLLRMIDLEQSIAKFLQTRNNSGFDKRVPMTTVAQIPLEDFDLYFGSHPIHEREMYGIQTTNAFGDIVYDVITQYSFSFPNLPNFGNNSSIIKNISFLRDDIGDQHYFQGLNLDWYHYRCVVLKMSIAHSSEFNMVQIGFQHVCQLYSYDVNGWVNSI